MDALDSAGVDVAPRVLLRAPDQFWSNLPRPKRERVLQALGIPLDPDTAKIALNTPQGGSRDLGTVRILIRGEPATPGPEALPSGRAPPPTPLEEEQGLVSAEDRPGSPGEALEPAAAAEPGALEPTAAGEAGALEAGTSGETGLVPTEDAQPPAPATAPGQAAEAQAPGAAEEARAPGAAAHANAPGPAANAREPDAEEAEAEEAEAEEADAESEPESSGGALVENPGEGGRERSGFLGRFVKRGGSQAEAGSHEPEGPVTRVEPICDERFEQVDLYAVQEPYAYIRIILDREAHEYIYEVIEPQLTERERNVLEFLEDTLIDVIEVSLSAVTEADAAKMLRKHVDEILFDYSVTLTPLSKEKILYYILRDFLGFGPLDPIMRDDLIEDVSCDGPGVPIFLYHRKYESVRSTVAFSTDDEADSYVIRMAQRSGKHISVAEPLLDATLPDGSRLNATLSDEVTANGSTFTIRKFRDDPFTAPDLIRFGTMNADLLAYWWLAVENGASAIYAGGTASGKTTSLNAILLFIPPQMKIVSIEDTREINIPHENWIAGVTRSGFGPRDNHGRQAGEIDMFTLLKAALRQRPEYILVGEVRGQEAYALFQAMATGHTAYGTMHADSAEAVIHRLESEPISIPRSLLEALDIVSIQIQTRIGGRRVRRTKELVEIVGLDPHTREILTNEVFSWNSTSDTFEFSGVSYVLERIQMERNISQQEMREELNRRKEVIDYMVWKSLRDYKQVGRIITQYYKDPHQFVDRIRKERALHGEAPEADPPTPEDTPAPEGEARDAGSGEPLDPGTLIATASPQGNSAEAGEDEHAEKLAALPPASENREDDEDHAAH